MENSEKRVAVISIVVRDRSVAPGINEILSRFGDAVLGRLGVPSHERSISIIVVLVDADNSKIGSISGSLGNLPGVTLRSTILL